MADDIVKRLLKVAAISEIIKDNPKIYYDAADAIIRLREHLAEADEANRRVSDENEKLRKALRPYADKYHWDIKHYDEVMSYGDLKAHDFYAAAAALGETDE